MKESLTVSLAQVPVVKGDVMGNLEHHIKMIKQSSCHNADVVVFPELSLTGYELTLASDLALSPEVQSFKELSQASIENEIIVVAGCPLIADKSSKPTIGAVVCFPNGTVDFYSKQYLHDGEDEYCATGDKDYLFKVNGYQVALAICADFVEPNHSQRARDLGADIYLVSALISETGFAADAKILSDIALAHRFPVLLSNHISMTGGWDVCGNNSIWNSRGEWVSSSASKNSGLLVCTIQDEKIKVVRV